MESLDKAVRQMMVALLSEFGITESEYVEKSLLVQSKGEDYKVFLAGYRVEFAIGDFNSELELLERYIMPAALALSKPIIKGAVGSHFLRLDGTLAE